MAKLKVIFNIDLSDPDDLMEYRRINQSLDMALAIWEIKYNLRKEIERELELKNAEESHYDLLHEIFQKIYTTINDHSIRIDELIV